MGKNCHDYIEGLSGYLENEIDSELCAEIEEHIGQCDNCRIMVDTLRKTVMLCRNGEPEELPESLRSKLNDLLKQRWEEKFRKNS